MNITLFQKLDSRKCVKQSDNDSGASFVNQSQREVKK